MDTDEMVKGSTCMHTFTLEALVCYESKTSICTECVKSIAVEKLNKYQSIPTEIFVYSLSVHRLKQITLQFVFYSTYCNKQIVGHTEQIHFSADWFGMNSAEHMYIKCCCAHTLPIDRIKRILRVSLVHVQCTQIYHCKMVRYCTMNIYVHMLCVFLHAALSAKNPINCGYPIETI